MVTEISCSVDSGIARQTAKKGLVELFINETIQDKI